MRAAALLLPLLALAACGNPEPQPTATPTATPTVAAPRTLLAADLDPATLGAKIAGPQGEEVETRLSTGTREIGTMTSYVACPADVTSCVPGAPLADTIYTYVHRITLSDAPAEEPTATASAGPEVVDNAPTLFRTTLPAAGFNGALGFVRSEAVAALGAKDAITVSNDAGHLIWRMAPGTKWKPGATVTLWWQSTAPPAGPQDAYLFELDGNQMRATGPFPAADKTDAPATPQKRG